MALINVARSWTANKTTTVCIETITASTPTWFSRAASHLTNVQYTIMSGIINDGFKIAEKCKTRLRGAISADRVTETLMAANPSWPEGAANAIPALTEYVYGIKRRDLKQVDLGATTKQQCLDNWEQLQELKKTVSN